MERMAAIFAARSTQFASRIHSGHPGRSNYGTKAMLHRIENAGGQSLHDIRGTLREATRAALWEADSRQEAGVVVGNAIRDVLASEGFDVQEVMDALETRQSYGRSRGRGRGLGFGPFGLGALQYATPIEEPSPEGPPAAEESTAPTPPTAQGLSLQLEVEFQPIAQTDDAGEIDDIDEGDEVDDIDDIDDIDEDSGAPVSRFELRFELEVGNSFELELELQMEGNLQGLGDSPESLLEAATSIVDAFLSQFSPGRMLSTTA